MKTAAVVEAGEVKAKPFKLKDFIPAEAEQVSPQKVSKNELKQIAEALGLKYEEEQISFTKKLINAYFEKDR